MKKSSDIKLAKIENKFIFTIMGTDHSHMISITSSYQRLNCIAGHIIKDIGQSVWS